MNTTARNPSPRDWPRPPRGSDIVFDTNDRGVSILVPARGLRRGGKGLSGFSLMLLAIGGLCITAAFLGEKAPLLLFGGGSIVAGAGLLGFVLVALRSTSRACFEATDGELRFDFGDLVLHRSAAWPAERIAHIDVDRANESMDARPIYELRLTRITEHETRLLAGRSRDELQWIAETLRRALDMPDEMAPVKRATMDEMDGQRRQRVAEAMAPTIRYGPYRWALG